MRDDPVIWETIRSVWDLAVGWRDDQPPRRYRLEQVGSGDFFSVALAPQSVKPFSCAPWELLLTIKRSYRGFSASPTLPKSERVEMRLESISKSLCL